METFCPPSVSHRWVSFTMNRLALRYYLPIVQILFLAGLLAAAEIERYEAAHRPPQALGWDIRSIDRPNIYGEAFAVLNAPAVFAALLMMEVLPRQDEWLLFLLLVVAMLVFWHALGRFFDRRRGLLPARLFQQRGKLWWVLAWLALAGAAAAMAIGVFLLVTMRRGDAPSLSLIGWPGFCGWMLLQEMRRQPSAAEGNGMRLTP